LKIHPLVFDLFKIPRFWKKLCLLHFVDQGLLAGAGERGAGFFVGAGEGEERKVFSLDGGEPG
jgi:hypothetical protein